MLKEAIQYVLENMRPEAQNLGNRAYIITQKGAQEVIETPIAPDTVPLHILLNFEFMESNEEAAPEIPAADSYQISVQVNGGEIYQRSE